MSNNMQEADSARQLPPIETASFSPDLGLVSVGSGKVRELFETPANNLLLVTTDRVSAFDRVLGTVPGKGQVLNELSAFWFEATQDIIPNHLIALPDPNVAVGKKLTPIPVEVIVRGVITGVTDTSLWVNYQKAVPDADGFREVYGIKFPPGLKKNDILPEPVITPTTKAAQGAHDEKLTEAEIVARNIVPEETWNTVREAAIAMFRRAQDIAKDRGFLLVDTKIEFGTDADGVVHVMDELFTPDSSRYWHMATLADRQATGAEPDNYDKEYLRIAYKAMGYGGEGSLPPQVPDEIRRELIRRYAAVYEGITGRTFVPYYDDAGLRIRANVAQYVVRETREAAEKEKRIPHVVIVMGSERDLEHASEIKKTLDRFGIAADLRVASAHKTPENLLSLISVYSEQKEKQHVYIAVAGRSNALGGMIAGSTVDPVINCPPKGEWYDLFSSLRMPSGIASSVIIEPESAAVFTAEIFAGTRPELARRIAEYQYGMKTAILDADERLK